MTITDLVTLFLSMFFLSRGYSRGFMNSLINPFSIIVTTILSIVYYQITKDTFTSLLIGLIGPLLLGFLLKLCLRTWARATNTDIKPDFFSRLGGSLLTMAWGWVFITFTLIFFAVLPSWGETLSAAHNDVTKSISYRQIARPLENIFFPDSKQNAATVISNASILNAQSLAQDPRFQKILQDPEIQNEINNHDFVKLMSNPKMMALTQEIMNDPATMKKVLNLYSSQTKPQASQNP